jgi:hypothetical protein
MVIQAQAAKVRSSPSTSEPTYATAARIGAGELRSVPAGCSSSSGLSVPPAFSTRGRHGLVLRVCAVPYVAQMVEHAHAHQALLQHLRRVQARQQAGGPLARPPLVGPHGGARGVQGYELGLPVRGRGADQGALEPGPNGEVLGALTARWLNKAFIVRSGCAPVLSAQYRWVTLFVAARISAAAARQSGPRVEAPTPSTPR